MSTNSGIYTITNRTTGQIYVGSAYKFSNRWRVHKSALKHGSHENIYLQRAWDEYGKDNFEFNPIFQCDTKYLLFYEQAIIDGYKAEIGWDNMYNLNPHAGVRRSTTGRSSLGSIKASISMKKRWEEARERGEGGLMNSLEILKNQKTLSPETKRKMSISRTGKVTSEETKEKLRQINLGRIVSPETIEKLRISHLGQSRKHTQETKDKISQSHIRFQEAKKLKESQG